MSIEAQVAAFEGGKLRVLASGQTSREAVLALPLNRLLVKMVRMPPGEDPVAVAEPVLKSMSPFPDDSITVGCETVREDGDGRVVIAAALPESAADDIGEALDAAKLNVVRIDSLALGQIRGVWPSLGESSGRRLVLLDSIDCLSCIVLDGDQPSAIRAITDRSDLRREIMLSLLEAENFGGARRLDEIILVETDSTGSTAPAGPTDSKDSLVTPTDPAGPTDSKDSFAALEAFAPVRRLTVGADAALVGVAERAADEGSLNALPASWRELLEETRFKAKLVRYLAIAGGIWLLIMAVLFGVPMVYDFLTDHQKSLSKQHQRQYREVKDMKAKVDLIRKYSDHARGALEIMKALSDRLPEEITLTTWNYKRDEGVRVSGEGDAAESVYAFKDAMDEMSAGEGEDGERIFPIVTLNGPNASKGRHRFDLDCQYKGEEEE
ncbi:MAG: hypothetical protein IKB76_01470 [Kiritimatiellae bacterium]|nr:hypothetical protein [Kiritimatiellia bacterium]